MVGLVTPSALLEDPLLTIKTVRDDAWRWLRARIGYPAQAQPPPEKRIGLEIAREARRNLADPTRKFRPWPPNPPRRLLP